MLLHACGLLNTHHREKLPLFDNLLENMPKAEA
jgi:hypothetical protein